MGNPMRAHTAIGELHQVKSGEPRRQGKVSDTDNVPAGDAVTMSLQSIKRTLKQTRRYPRTDLLSSSKSESSSHGTRSDAGQSKIDQETARK
jgi:hypothetical protein